LAAHEEISEGEYMKKMILLLGFVLAAGAAYAGETVKGEFFVGGGVEPAGISHTMISILDGKYKSCTAHASGKLTGKRLMLKVDLIDCNGKASKVKGTVYDEANIRGIDVTLARVGQLTIFPGQGVIVKLK
jgi:hypothetical protein